MVVKALFPLLGTPNSDAVPDEPLHHKGSFIRDAPDAVKHKHQQDVKLLLLCVFLDDLEFVPVFRPNLMAGDPILLLFVDNGPTLFLRKAVTGFSLHRNIRLAPVVIIYLFIGGHTIKTIHSIFHNDSVLSNVMTIERCFRGNFLYKIFKVRRGRSHSYYPLFRWGSQMCKFLRQKFFWPQRRKEASALPAERPPGFPGAQKRPSPHDLQW